MPELARARQAGGPADTFAAIATWVRAHLGMVFSAEQMEEFANRLRAYMLSKGLTPVRLLALLEGGDARSAQEVAEVISTNYTFFMRETETLEYMREHVFPRLPSGPIRIWSAAASSGDEAYTAAIYALEHFGLEAAGRVRILGTDISQRQIDQAERGEYQLQQLALVDSARRARWFVPARGGPSLGPASVVRAMCTFRRMNLARFPWPFTRRFHIIFLRNVLYYLDRPLRQRVLDACYEATEVGGFVLTSLTEPMLDVRTKFRCAAPAVYTRGSL